MPGHGLRPATGALEQAGDDIVLDVRGLCKEYPVRSSGWLRRGHAVQLAVDDVSFRIGRGETLGLAGGSGCGKTTVARCIAGIIQPTRGSIAARARPTGPLLERSASPDVARALRRGIQMVFQDPLASLDPRMIVSDLISEPLDVQASGSRADRRSRVLELVEWVGLDRAHLTRLPHELSGGQRQRVGVARALALEPALVVLDEPVSALDVSIRAQILNLLMDLQARLGIAYLFIGHDLSVVRHVSDRVAVMYQGRLVEVADRDTLARDPWHPYTRFLLGSIPSLDPSEARRQRLGSRDVRRPSGDEGAGGCAYRSTCPNARSDGPCATTAPQLEQGGPRHLVACHFPVGADPEA